jgi:transmembrane sensor
MSNPQYEDDGTRRLAQAAVWRVRLTEMDLQTSAEFEAWRSENTANEAAWRRVNAPWDLLGDEAASGAMMASRRAMPARTTAPMHSAVTGRSTALGARFSAFAAVLLLAAAAAAWLNSRPAVYDTAFGERRVVMLEDGSRVSLDSDSAIEVRYSRKSRRIELTHGQARFDVAHGLPRPFIVDAGDRTVTATGTSFNIDLRASTILVTLIEGSVRVSSSPASPPGSAASAAGPLVLSAGQTLTAAIAMAVPPRIEPAHLNSVTSWQSGRFVVDDEPLGEVVERANRYSRFRIAVADERAAQLRLSGVFHTDDIATFLDTVSRYLPVHVTTNTGGVRIISSE